MSFPILIAITTLLDLVAVIAARYYVLKKKTWIMLFSMSLWAISAIVYVEMLAYAVTAVVNIIYVSISAVFVTVACFFIFKERISWLQGVGMLIVVLGLSMLEF